jgi:hypothetical protein
MHNLAITYQTEKKMIVRNDFSSVVIEALHNLHNLHNLCREVCHFTVTVKDVVKQVMALSETEDSETEDPETIEKNARSLSTRVGVTLRQLRFERKGQEKRGEPVTWRVSGDVLLKCIFSHGLLHLLPKEGCEGYAEEHPAGPSENSADAAQPKNSSAQPSDPQDTGYVGYEVIRDNKNNEIGHSAPLDDWAPWTCDTCGGHRGELQSSGKIYCLDCIGLEAS